MKNFGLVTALSLVLSFGLMSLPAVQLPVAAEGPADTPALLLAVPPGETESKVWLDKTTFAPGEEIQVHFSTPSTYPKEAWIGIGRFSDVCRDRIGTHTPTGLEDKIGRTRASRQSS